MKFKKTKIAALALAGFLTCGGLAGCGLVTTDSARDLTQVIAEIDISKGEAFASGGEFSDYASAIQKSEILKRELVASYASYGSTYVSVYGMSAQQAYEYIMSSLVNRQIYLQYARAYFFKNGFTEVKEDGSETFHSYTLEGYNAAIAAASEQEKEIAGLAYFLDIPGEKETAEYNVKVTLNSTLDSQEHEVIEGNHTHDHSSETTTPSSRTTPTGVDTTNEDFYDPAYKIYLGTNSPSDCGTYEPQDESTPATRKKAYKTFLANLNVYGLIEKGENTSDITSLSYYQIERKNQYETAIINKLNKAFEYEAEKEIDEEWIKSEKYEKTLSAQKAAFSVPDNTALTSALDGASESNFVFYAPEGYGYVINILLPFSASQTQEINDARPDFNDPKGNKFVTRASVLQKLTATDQRGPWFASGYGFKAEAEDKAFGGESRKYLFFENNLKKSAIPENGIEAQYQKLQNYYGSYTYNGEVSEKEEDGETVYTFKPNKLSIDEFLQEMESYLNFAGLDLTEEEFTPGYYDRTSADYYDENGDVDYSKFVYYKAKIAQLSDFDANRMFVEGSEENIALSVINELSFAYNTDTAGLNSRFGYSVSPTTTNFVKEFEYAAQEAVRMGPGGITVAPSEYGWHIMFCTLAYHGDEIYTFDWNQIHEEGTFSYLYYEALKADNFTQFSSDRQTSIINGLDNDDCVTIYTKRYEDRYSV